MNLNKIVSIFKTPKTLSTNKGFSLVELMVVVAIIGILASVAIPSVNKYMAKARQTEAKTNLSSLYTAEKAFFVEFNTYDSRFGAVGFSPEGKIRYNIGFAGVGVQADAANGYMTTDPGGQWASTDAQAYCGVSGAMQNSCTLLNGVDGAQPPAIVAAACTLSAPATCETATNEFSAGATARIDSANTASNDSWSINHLKELVNSEAGIR